jgi:hypothetical protein
LLKGTLAATSLARTFQSAPGVRTCYRYVVPRTSFFDLCSCHTRFYKENRMHLMYAPGSIYTHMIDNRV